MKQHISHRGKHFLKASFLSAAIAALGIGAVSAQTQQPSAQPGQRMERPFTKPTDRVEAQLAYQKTALKITGAQEAQWTAYAEFTRKQARDMEQRFDQMRAQRGGNAPGARQARQRPNAIESLERQQTMLSEVSRRIGERLAVQKPLYAALSPEQQKVADQVLSTRGGPGRGGQHMRGREGRFSRG